MPDTECPRCQAIGFVRKERVIHGDKAIVECVCGSCNYVWVGNDRCDAPDRRGTGRPPRSDRRKAG